MALNFSYSEEVFSQRPTRLSYIDVDSELDRKIEAALEEWVLRVSYSVTYDYDDGESTTSDVRYKELYKPRVVVVNNEPVGILLKHTIYENNNSNCTYTNLYVLSFRDGANVNIKLEGSRSGHHYVEGTAFYSLKRRADLNEGVKVESASSEFFPVPSVF